MKKKIPLQILVTGIELLAFILAYYVPFLMQSSDMAIRDARVSTMLFTALAVPAIYVELVRNLAGQLLPLLFCYAAAHWAAGQVTSVTGVRPAIQRWLLLLATWLLMVAGNRLLFPLSDYSVPFDAIARPVIALLAALVLLAALLAALLQAFSPKRALLGASLFAIVAASVGAKPWHFDTDTDRSPPRNIIIVGIDSLSNQMMDDVEGELPYVARLLASGTRFTRAYTPIGRTFPAWVSLLSGSPPADHGAVFNLRAVARVDRDALVTKLLNEVGYKTVFASDERRFSNLDESFGFERIVGPKVGALDFVLQRLNDTPLTNVILQTHLARHLFPFSYLNAASHVNYNAEAFVDETLAATEGDKPLFLAVHFESAHFPFKTRHAVRTFEHPNGFVARHGTALTVVDDQVSRLMEGLHATGRLNDALVIVMSDHGESLGEVEASITRDGEPVEVVTFGHGSRLLSEHQSRIVLGLVKFRDGRVTGPISLRADQVSLTDLRAMIERYVKTGEVELEPQQDCMTVETGIRLSALSSYRTLDNAEVAREGAASYEIDHTGRLRLRENGLFQLINLKDVGWRCRDRLTYFSSADKRYFSYRLLEEGRSFEETEVTDEDVERIEAYRSKLRHVVSG